MYRHRIIMGLPPEVTRSVSSVRTSTSQGRDFLRAFPCLKRESETFTQMWSCMFATYNHPMTATVFTASHVLTSANWPIHIACSGLPPSIWGHLVSSV